MGTQTHIASCMRRGRGTISSAALHPQSEAACTGRTASIRAQSCPAGILSSLLFTVHFQKVAETPTVQTRPGSTVMDMSSAL